MAVLFKAQIKHASSTSIHQSFPPSSLLPTPTFFVPKLDVRNEERPLNQSEDHNSAGQRPVQWVITPMSQPKVEWNIGFRADTGQNKSLAMQMQLTGRPRMGLSWIQLSKGDEELCLVFFFTFACEKV